MSFERWCKPVVHSSGASVSTAMRSSTIQFDDEMSDPNSRGRLPSRSHLSLARRHTRATITVWGEACGHREREEGGEIQIRDVLGWAWGAHPAVRTRSHDRPSGISPQLPSSTCRFTSIVCAPGLSSIASDSSDIR